VIWELLVGLRYMRSRRRWVPLSLISTISLVGVTIGVATLLIVLGIMTGMEQDFREKILGFNPHITVTSFSGPLDDWEDAIGRVRKVDGVTAAGPVVYGQAMVSIGRTVSGVIVRAIDPSRGDIVVDVKHHMQKGSVDALAKPQEVTLPPEEGGGHVQLGALLIGKELARQLGVTVGEIVNVISPLGTPGPTGMVPRIKRFVVAGIFDSGMYDYDQTLAYMSLADAQKFFELKDEVSALEVRVGDVYAAGSIARRIEQALGGFPYRARDWTEANRNIFAALKLQTVTSGIVLCLIVVVAAFNILAALTMVVKEKRRDIAILMSMGASRRAIARLFVVMGSVIGVSGTVAGELLGLGGCLLLQRYQFIDLPKDVFIFTELPVDVNPVNFLVVGALSITICVLAALSPARRAASLVPVEVIRYE
jgi:lipoprotein-releasing system permease protein